MRPDRGSGQVPRGESYPKSTSILQKQGSSSTWFTGLPFTIAPTALLTPETLSTHSVYQINPKLNGLT